MADLLLGKWGRVPSFSTRRNDSRTSGRRSVTRGPQRGSDAVDKTRAEPHPLKMEATGPLWHRILREYANVQRKSIKSKAGYPSDGVIESDGMADVAQTLVDSANLTREMAVRKLTDHATENGVLHVCHMADHGDGEFLIPVGATNTEIIKMIKDAKD